MEKSNSFYDLEAEKTQFFTRKKRDTEEKQINDLFEDIIQQCLDGPKSFIFAAPVSKKLYPDYYDRIEFPMDLSTMRAKTKRREYLKREDFIDDLNLIYSNSIRYNGVQHEVSLCAKEMVETGLKFIEK